jgi:hypothetical protein
MASFAFTLSTGQRMRFGADVNMPELRLKGLKALKLGCKKSGRATGRQAELAREDFAMKFRHTEVLE